jgi:hypothetical protein
MGRRGEEAKAACSDKSPDTEFHQAPSCARILEHTDTMSAAADSLGETLRIVPLEGVAHDGVRVGILLRPA